MLAYIIVKFEIILRLLFDIQPLVTIGNKKYANCGHQEANSAARMQVHHIR